jgi:hypothetical protein
MSGLETAIGLAALVFSLVSVLVIDHEMAILALVATAVGFGMLIGR